KDKKVKGYKEEDQTEKGSDPEKSGNNNKSDTNSVPKYPVHILSGGGDSSEDSEENSEEDKKENNSPDNQDEPEDPENSDKQKDQKEKQENEPDPPQISLIQTPSNLTTSTEANFELQTQNASTTYLELDGERTTTGTTTIELKGLSDGEHTFTAVATNTSRVASTSHTWTIDTEDPEPPRLTPGAQNRGYYWIADNKARLTGTKNKDVSKIIIKTNTSSSPVAVATGTETWNIEHEFSFRCPQTSINNLYDCPSLRGKMRNPEKLKTALKSFHKKKIELEAVDIWGRHSSAISAQFRLDRSSPQIMFTGERHSLADNRVLLLSGFSDNSLNIPNFPSPLAPDFSDLNLHSGIQEKTWQYRLGSDSRWQNASTTPVTMDGHEMDLFSAEFGRNYNIRLRLRDRAGHIATSAPEAIELNLPTSSYPVISEIYPNASTTEHGGEWIELYNPNNQDISLKNYSLDTATYEDDAEFSATSTIPAHGFYLIGDKDWTPDKNSWPKPDLGATITLKNSDGWLRLKDGQGRQVDYVEYNKIDPLHSKERKAYIHSTKQTMTPGGDHHDRGNIWDTNDSVNDFITKDTPEPQNSSSSPEKWEF
ncbi:MAG TPA: lamin tail domain-containing protein, partial [Patescibacteria group bacterium]|nr:lamin tail domain-containing protein [Patescibacteria group bacterium]